MYTGPDIQDGMHVYDSADQKMGVVADVYPNLGDWETHEGGEGESTQTEEVTVVETPESEVVAVSEGSVGSGTHQRAHAWPPENIPYFRLDQGGVLGIGAKHLYIPFDVIARVDMNEARLWLNCTRDEAAQRYASKPAFLEQR